MPVLPVLIALVIPAAIGVAFLAFVWRARNPVPVVMRTTMPPEETYYSDMDKPNGLFNL